MKWKDLRIAAINRLSKRKGYQFSDRNPYFDEWLNVLKSKAHSKQDYLKERFDNAQK